MADKKYEWHLIAASPAEIILAENGIGITEIKGKKICITQHNEQWFAFAYKCPHASGIMADGYIDAIGNIVCPVHRYKFNLHNGRNTTGEGYYLKTYPVECRENGVFIGMQASGFFNW
jgi:nitrite reductase/ring-hydroxylating ferredoxin subunit